MGMGAAFFFVYQPPILKFPAPTHNFREPGCGRGEVFFAAYLHDSQQRPGLVLVYQPPILNSPTPHVFTGSLGVGGGEVFFAAYLHDSQHRPGTWPGVLPSKHTGLKHCTPAQLLGAAACAGTLYGFSPSIAECRSIATTLSGA